MLNDISKKIGLRYRLWVAICAFFRITLCELNNDEAIAIPIAQLFCLLATNLLAQGRSTIGMTKRV